MNEHPAHFQSLAGGEVIQRLASDIVLFLQNWMLKTDPILCAEIEALGEEIDRFANSKNKKRYKYKWTAAIYIYFSRLAENPEKIISSPRNKWTLYPKKKPYAGEFITDFSIYEDQYGFRITCESQSHEGQKNKARIADAFAKLLHVKSDLKVLIFESPHDEENSETKTLFDALRNDYLDGYMHFNAHEDYLLMQWSGDKVKCHLWRPLVSSDLILMNVGTL
jgi:hypothetical protein